MTRCASTLAPLSVPAPTRYPFHCMCSHHSCRQTILSTKKLSLRLSLLFPIAKGDVASGCSIDKVIFSDDRARSTSADTTPAAGRPRYSCSSPQDRTSSWFPNARLMCNSSKNGALDKEPGRSKVLKSPTIQRPAGSGPDHPVINPGALARVISIVNARCASLSRSRSLSRIISRRDGSFWKTICWSSCT